ncbi:hypothetical protein B0A49_02133 [Cryomyces minteri]|uniref:Uncharacterized protein n=1 Tax=Cryomyces minteri TaxID=331657 RepID=A0A4U0XNT1_9PEZI|nr:hypothetical protein B0A49_02133 [Cryomyces minteri]
MFFKRLSRSRSNSRSNSYVDNSYSNGQYDGNEKHDSVLRDRPSSSRDSQGQPLKYSQQTQSPTTEHNPALAKETNMYSRQSAPQEPYSQRAPLANGMGHSGLDTMASPVKTDPIPDLLTRAFNEATRPYTDKIEMLEGQIADLQAWIEQLELQRSEVHSWIDKRGLRPDVPPSIAKVMDASSDGAAALNGQLDRKITIVNFDLHRLQDDLNDSISSSHFASAMSKFLPDIQRLSLLPSGPRYAFDLVLKLGGNLNSHTGIEGGDAGDLDARREFYARLDESMVDVVRRRFGEQEDWAVAREVKRIEKTGAYLKNFGIEPYFPATLDVMKREMEFRGQGTPPRYQ